MITKRDDDYLICKEYQDRINEVSADHPGYITFKHPNGNHYFAWVDDGHVILRSEAYPDEEKMIRGINAVNKNRDLIERYSVDSQHGVHFLVLWGGGNHQEHTGNFESHNEIGRSCPKKSREELHALLLHKGRDFAQAVVPLDESASGAAVAAAAAAATVIDTSAEDAERARLDAEAKARAEADRMEAEAKAEADRVKAAAAATVAAAATSYAASEKRAASAPRVDASTISDDSSGGGFKWWYLLPLLLLGLLGLKMCKKDGGANGDASAAVPDTTTTTNEPAGATADTTTARTAPAEAAKPAAPDCNLNWILFDFDKFDITSQASGELKTMADILKGNTDYVADLSAHTDAKGSNEYNDALSSNRANEAKKALVAMGIDASRITTSASSEGDPIASNTEDDAGRRFNRRVELRVKDKSGKEICKSIPPDVPSNLKVK